MRCFIRALFLALALGPTLGLGPAWGAQASPAAASAPLPRRPSPSQLRQELLRMAERDQAMRLAMFHEGKTPSEAENRALSAQDALHTQAMKAILAQVGWPGLSLVGPEGAKAAFLLVQHSPDSAFMAKALPLLEAAARKGEANLRDWATMHDRVRLAQGGRQRFGTQFELEADRLVLSPCEAPEDLDARRAGVGLPSMAEQDGLLRELYGLPVDRPQAGQAAKPWCPWPWPPASRP